MDRAQLAAVLRAARSRITPADVGLPAGRRRQVPGLRREEVAQLAGLGIDYVIRLEQGRGPRPSPQVLNPLARALRLSNDDRTTLFRLAGSTPPQAATVPMQVHWTTQRLLDRVGELPALVLSAKSDVLAWNALAAALFGGFSASPPARRNLIRQRFFGTGIGRVTVIPQLGSAAFERSARARGDKTIGIGPTDSPRPRAARPPRRACRHLVFPQLTKHLAETVRVLPYLDSRSSSSHAVSGPDVAEPEPYARSSGPGRDDFTGTSANGVRT